MPENLPEKILESQRKFDKFLSEVVRPLSVEVEDSGSPPSENIELVRRESKARGFYHKTQPLEYGGDPANSLELTLLRETLAGINSPYASFVFGPGPGILHATEGKLAEHYLKPVLQGEKRGAFGFTEPDDARRPSWAILENDNLIINGQKSYVSGGLNCDFVTILINVENNHGEKLGTAMVVVDREAEGVSIQREFVSMEGGGHVSMRFENVQVSVDQVIGNIGEGMPRALGNIANVRMMVAAEAVGLSIWTIGFVEQHLLKPHRSGAPLGEREGVRLRLADMRIETYVARSALYRTARMIDSGEKSINEIIATKIFCTESAGRVIDMAVQLVGGQALVCGHPLEFLYRRVRSMRLIEGASDLLRLNLVKGKLELKKGTL